MASVGRKIAQGMTGFAAGVMKEVDGKSMTKKIASEMKAGVKGPVARNSARQITQSGGYQFGRQVASAKPMMGMTQTARHLMGTNGATKMGLGQAIKQGHMVDGKLSGTRVAGSIGTLGVAGRVASGGGLYKDKYGNTNLPGVPFI